MNEIETTLESATAAAIDHPSFGRAETSRTVGGR